MGWGGMLISRTWPEENGKMQSDSFKLGTNCSCDFVAAVSSWGKCLVTSVVLGIGKHYHSELMAFPKFLLFSFPRCPVKCAKPREGQYIGVILSVSLTVEDSQSMSGSCWKDERSLPRMWEWGVWTAQLHACYLRTGWWLRAPSAWKMRDAHTWIRKQFKQKI